MNRLLLAALGLIVSGSAAHASPIFDFTFTGSIVDFTVPTTDLYQILAFGAQGGNAVANPDSGIFIGPGGLGAEIGGNFTLVAGETLLVAVGGAGSNKGFDTGAGGGGGSFVVGPGNLPLIIAGGGGGGGAIPSESIPLPGEGGLAGPDGGSLNANVAGGAGGDGGGAGGLLGGGGGGGFLSPGGSTEVEGIILGIGGGAFPAIGASTHDGGFGGGGGSGFNAAGGGGGYSGGGGGFNSGGLGGIAPGGGGGSLDAGTEQILIAGVRTGNGEVIITEIPEPGSITLLGTGLLLAACLFLPARRFHRRV